MRKVKLSKAQRKIVDEIARKMKKLDAGAVEGNVVSVGWSPSADPVRA